MKLLLPRKPAFILVASMAALASSAQVKAQTTGWLGDGGTTAWSDAANWFGGVPGGPVVELFFGTAYAASPGGNNATTANNDLTGLILQKITFEANAPAFTLTGNGFSLATAGADAPQLVNNSASLQTLNLAGGLSFNGGAGGFAELKAVAGDLAFSATTALTLDNATQLRVSAEASRTVTFGGAIGGSGALVKNGAGLVKLAVANTYSAGTTINEGMLEFATGALGTSGAITFGGGTLRFGAGNTEDIAGRLAGSTSAIRIDTNGNDVTFAGAINGSNTGGLIKNGAGVLFLASTASNFTGNLIINGGTVAATGGLLPPNPGGTSLGATNVARQVIVNAGARLEFRQHDVMGNDGANPLLTFVVNGGRIVAQPGSQASGNGPFNILPAVTLNGGSISAANGANGGFQSLSLKGTITVTGSAPSAIDTTGSAGLFNGVHLTQVGGNIFDVADVTGNAAIDLDVSARLINRSGDLAASSLIKQGPGTMQLSHAETAYTGSTSVLAGTLLINGGLSPLSNVMVADGAGFGRTAGGSLTLASLQLAGQATLSFSAQPGTQTSGSVFVAGDGQFVVSGGPGSVLVNVGGGGLTVGQSYALLRYTGFFGGDIGTFTLGAKPSRVLGELVLNAANASLDFKVNATDAARWTGAVSGEWSTAVLTPTKNWVLNSNGTTPTDFISGDSVFFTDAATRTDLTVNTADINVGAMNFNNSTKNYTISGSKSITGGASLIKSGTGTLTISNVNTFGGGAAINEGLIVFGAGGLGAAGPISFGENANLRYAAGNSDDIGGRLANSAGPIRIDFNGNNVVFGGAINATNTGGFIKNGAGVLTLGSNASSFTGDFVINAGTVAVTSGLLPDAPTGTGLGAVNVARQIIVNAGASLELRQHDVLGNDVANPQVAFVLNGGSLIAQPGGQASGFGPYNILPAVTLNGATIRAAGGANNNYQSFGLKAQLTITGSMPSKIETIGDAATFNGVHLSQQGGNVFEVADVTGNAAVDFEVSARLINMSGSLAPASLIKQGLGTMVLSNAGNSYAGVTTVSAGTLLINGGINPLTTVTVADGAGFGRTAAGTLTVSGLQFLGQGTLSASATPASQISGSIAVTGDGAFAVGGGAGSILVNVSGGGLAIGESYALIKYTGFFGGDAATFSLGSVPSRVLGELVLNAGNGSLDFKVNATDAARWTGAASGEWSTAVLTPTKNWVLNSNGTTPTDFINGDTVFFTDTPTRTDVTINTTDVTPGLINFANSTKNYTLSGSKGITGGGSLVKAGTGTLTITNVNSFTGGTTINEGAIEFASGGLGAAGGITFGGGKLRYAAGNTQDISGRVANSTSPIRLDTNGNNLTFGGSFGASNTGGFVKDGAGIVTVSAGQGYSGDTIINAGTINVGLAANVANPVLTGLGNMTVPRQVIVNAGATLAITAGNDSFGAFDYVSPVTFVVDGGTFSHGNQFLTINSVVLKNGGRLTGNNGVDPRFSGFSILGSVTVSGTGASFLSTTGTVNPGTNLGSVANPNVIFNIGNTGAVGGDFIVTSPLLWEATAHTSGVIKSGPGTMVLNYNAIPNLYPGSTVIDEGTIIINGAINPSTTVIVGDGAGFGRMAPGPLTVAGLSFGNLGTLSAYASPTTQTSGSIVISTPDGFITAGGAGSITVNVSGSGLSAGQTYSLVKFSGNFPGASTTFALGSKPAGVVGSLILNALSGSLDFSVTSAASTEWRGAASGAWSTAVLTPTKNWNSGGTPADYANGDSVFFGDTATTTNVTIDGANVSPGAVNFNHSTKDYTLGGTNGIEGTASLTKGGTGTLTLTNTNSYTGGTFLNGGLLVFSAGALGTTGPITFGGGTLRYGAGNTVDVSGRIGNSTAAIRIDTAGQNVIFATPLNASNTGGLVKNGAGLLTLSSNASTFTGDFVIDGGTVAVTAGLLPAAPTGTALGSPNVARQIIVNAGGTLEFRQHDVLGNDAANPMMTIVLNGGKFVSLSGSQASGNGPFNILPAVNMNGGTITATNGAFQAVQSLSLKGTITVAGNSPSLINTTGTAALLDGVHLTQAGGNIFDVGDATGNAAVDLEVSARLVNFAGPMSGNPLLKRGLGTMLLSNAANENTGPTAVEAGILLLNGSISGSDVQVAADGTLGGQGTMKSLLLTGGVLSPSNPATPSAGIGTLNTVSDAFLQGTSHFDLRKSGATLTADLLVSQSQIIYAGKLEIVAGGDALAGGEVFNLFDAPILSGGVFDTISLPTFADPNLSWDTTQLTVDGTISVVPEPGSVGLLLGGLGLVAGFRRRRA